MRLDYFCPSHSFGFNYLFLSCTTDVHLLLSVPSLRPGNHMYRKLRRRSSESRLDCHCLFTIFLAVKISLIYLSAYCDTKNCDCPTPLHPRLCHWFPLLLRVNGCRCAIIGFIYYHVSYQDKAHLKNFAQYHSCKVQPPGNVYVFVDPVWRADWACEKRHQPVLSPCSWRTKHPFSSSSTGKNALW